MEEKVAMFLLVVCHRAGPEHVYQVQPHRGQVGEAPHPPPRPQPGNICLQGIGSFSYKKETLLFALLRKKYLLG